MAKDAKNKQAKPAEPVAPKTKAGELEPRQMNIYQKIAAITGEVGAIAKGGQNKEQGYAFIEYAAVAGELRQLFAKYGVVIIPNMPPVAEQHRNEFTTKNGKGGVALLIDFKFDIVNADAPEDRFNVGWTGEAVDYGDKATNKAATAALKYYLMRQFNISEKGEQEADNQTPERPAYEPALPPPPPQIKLITQEHIDEIGGILASKGMHEADDQMTLVQKMARTQDVMTITASAAEAIINRLRPAKILPLFTYIGKQPPANDDIDDLPGDDIDQTPPDDTPSDLNPPAEPQVQPDPPADEVIDEDERTIAATNKAAVGLDFKQQVRASLDALGLKPQERMRLLKEATGKVTDGNLTDQEWRNFGAAVDDYAIKLADETTSAETPQKQTQIEGTEGNANDNDTPATAA